MHMQQYCLFVQCRNVLLSRYCTVEDRRRRHNIYTFPHIVRMSACVCARATIDHVMCVGGGGGEPIAPGPLLLCQLSAFSSTPSSVSKIIAFKQEFNRAWIYICFNKYCWTFSVFEKCSHTNSPLFGVAFGNNAELFHNVV